MARPEREEVREEDDEPVANYRVAPTDLDRTAKLEQENGQLKDQIRALEREVYAARKTLRRRKVATAVQTGGVVATFASLIVLVAYALGLFEAPVVAPAILVAWCLGALGGYRWDPPDDDFPDAPPARLR